MSYFSRHKRWISVVTVMMLCLVFSLSSFALNESESNNTAATADVMYDDQNNYGYISTPNDVDWWYVSFSQGGWANYYLGNIPSGCNYDLYLYSANGTTLLESSTNTGNAYELIRYDVVANTIYRVCIVSKSGYSNSSAYMIRTKRYPSDSAKVFVYNCTDINTVPTADATLPILWKMGYDAGSHLNNSISSAWSVINNHDVFLVHNHGGPGRIRFDTSSTNFTRLYAETHSSMSSVNKALDTVNLTGVKLMIFAGCETSLTHETYGNLVETALEQGAACAIGWDVLTYTGYTTIWLEQFFLSCAQGETIYDSIIAADQYIEDTCTDARAEASTRWYFSYSNVDQVIG